MFVSVSIKRKLVVSFLLGILFNFLVFSIYVTFSQFLQHGSHWFLLKPVKTDFNDLQKWSQSIPNLVSEDINRTKKLFKPTKNLSLPQLRDQFYSFANMPLQSVCTVGKFFGGQWLGQCGAFDGHKFVCLDKFFGDVIHGTCLIYSFGIAGDWSFEEAMADLGCTVRAFDPTIDGKSKPASDLITFKKIGLKEFTGNVAGFGQVMTLKDAVASMGDTGKVISYLKVDIEGSETSAIPEWVESGILSQVTQVGIELHTGLTAFGRKDLAVKFSKILETMKMLHRAGFHLISKSNNDCVGKNDDIKKRYLSLVEVVFYTPGNKSLKDTAFP